MTDYIDMHPSFATRPNLDLLEQNYERWQKDPDSLDSGWSAFFEGFELGSLDGKNGAAVEAPREARRDLREVRCKRELTLWFTLIAFSGTPSHG